MTDVALRAFVSIDSDERPGTYRAVSARVSTDDAEVERVERKSGNFLLDWQNVMIRISQLAEQHDAKVVWLQFSSSVDMWEADSCRYESFLNEGWLWWKEADAQHRAVLRGDRFLAHFSDDLKLLVEGKP
jgi:hypothetical protein